MNFRNAKLEVAKLLILNSQDTVAMALHEIEPGETQTLPNGKTLVAQGMIPKFHKIALEPINIDDAVIKYGQVIGLATSIILAGDHVHVHNLKSRRASKKQDIDGRSPCE